MSDIIQPNREAEEQKTKESSMNYDWRKRFQKYLENFEFESARKYAERKKIETSSICRASYDFFSRLVRDGRKREYLGMIRAFGGYSFEGWLPDSNIKPQVYKLTRRY